MISPEAQAIRTPKACRCRICCKTFLRKKTKIELRLRFGPCFAEKLSQCKRSRLSSFDIAKSMSRFGQNIPKRRQLASNSQFSTCFFCNFQRDAKNLATFLPSNRGTYGASPWPSLRPVSPRGHPGRRSKRPAPSSTGHGRVGKKKTWDGKMEE